MNPYWPWSGVPFKCNIFSYFQYFQPSIISIYLSILLSLLWWCFNPYFSCSCYRSFWTPPPPHVDLYRPPTNQECITFHSPNRIGVVCKPIRKLICKNNCVTLCQIQNHGETCNFAILSVAHFTLQFFHFFLRIHCEYINARQGLWTDGAGGGGEFSLLGHSRMPNC